MAENKTLFRQESLDRMQSPEKTDEYIRVSSPKAWILVAALLLIAAGVLVWGFVGSIPKTISVSAVVMEEYNGDAVCLLPVGTAGQYLVGHEAFVTLPDGSGLPGTVTAVSEDPYSYEEVSSMARSNWRLRAIWGDAGEMYKYAVVVDCAALLPDRELVAVSVVLSDVKPIEYVLN